MLRDKTCRSVTGCRGTAIPAIFWLAAISGGASHWAYAADNVKDDTKNILRWDYITRKPVNVPPSELIVGYVYYHYDARQGRWAWAHLEKNGHFSIAMDPGSAQPARLFGFNTENKEAMDLLQRVDPKLYEEVRREAADPYLKLDADQKWKLTRTTVPLIYNEATGERWEMQFGKYRPVCHLYGYSWRRSGERYAPAF